MLEYIYIPIILLLYLKTWKYCYLIDDFVPRGGYLLNLGDNPPKPSFYDTQRPIMATVTNIGVFIATCFAIHHSWGWKVALAYAVFPLNVSGVAWITGNYYMTTVLLTLTTYFFAQMGIVGTAVAIPLFVSALGSTVSAIPFAFVCPLITGNPLHLVFLLPLLFFLFGHRFKTGLSLRKERHEDIYIKAGVFNPRVVFLMAKIVAYYALISLFPSRLGMWHDFHRNEADNRLLGNPSRLFWLSCILLTLFALWGFGVDWRMTLWWFAFMGLFSQFVTFGMMVAERYTYVANVGFCALVTAFLPTELYLILMTLWFARSWIYIKVFKSNKSFFLAGANAFPNTPENYMNYAAYYLAKKNPFKAIEPLLRANDICKGKNSGINQNLASCYYDCKNYSKAKFYIEKALENCQQTNRDKLLNWLDKLNNKLEKIQENNQMLKEKGII